VPPAARQLPVPQAHAFVICREIWKDSRHGELMLVGPVSHMNIPAKAFPLNVTLSAYAHVTGGHGVYSFELALRAPSGEAIWRWFPEGQMEHTDPLILHQMSYHDMVILIPAPARYCMALIVAGEEIAHQPILIGPNEMFRAGGIQIRDL
jgi:hypothetical protein